jgi:hypothetical protein
MTPFARAYALALHNADPTRDMMDCMREAVRRENIKLRIDADRRAAETFAKRSRSQKRAWKARKAKLAASVSKK